MLLHASLGHAVAVLIYTGTVVSCMQSVVAFATSTQVGSGRCTNNRPAVGLVPGAQVDRVVAEGAFSGAALPPTGRLPVAVRRLF